MSEIIKKPRGFAAMTPEKRRAIAARGGANSGGNFKHDREKAAIAGRKGGRTSRRKVPSET